MRGREDFDAVDASAALQIVVIFILSFVLLVLNNRTLEILGRIVPTAAGIWLFTFGIFAISAVWSLKPEYSFYRAMEFMVFFISIFVAMSYYTEFKKAERVFCSVVIVACVFDVLRFVMGPNFLSRFAGLGYWHTNSYTHAAGMLLCYAVGEYFMATGPRKIFLKRVAMIGGFLTLLGTSAGSTIGAVAGL